MSQRARAGIAALAVLVQCAALYVPRGLEVETGGMPLDKAVHVLIFTLPTVALVVAGAPRAWVIALMALHAPLSELVQHLILPVRSGDAGDIAADLVGVAIGAYLTRGGRLAPAPALMHRSRLP